MYTRERESAEICEEYFDNLLYTEETKELLKIVNREINEFEVELTALKRKSVALKRASCGEEEEYCCCSCCCCWWWRQ
jgi:hypothetical protein